MNRKKIVHLVAGARPNFMKVAPLYHALKKTSWARPVLVHTGQHSGEKMSGVFFHDLRLPTPEFRLRILGGSHARQTGTVMMKYEKLCIRHRPDLVVVVGDVDSTLAATLAAKKMGLPVAHLEAGLRSRDRTMPEEINRVLVDAVADFLWTPSPEADRNLLAEGVARHRIQRVGNIMIDSLHLCRSRILNSPVLRRYHLNPLDYVLVTLHRPANVDDSTSLGIAVDQIIKLAGRLPVVFPVHPRTRQKMKAFGLWKKAKTRGLQMPEPLGYIDFLGLLSNARLVVTDSGGIQEEASCLGIPCLTARKTTERPITCKLGTNQLVPLRKIASQARMTLLRPRKKAIRPIPLWDGRTASRVVDHLRKYFKQIELT